PPNLPYYPPQGYMAKFGKMTRQRFYPAEDAEPYYAAGVRHAASYKPKKDEAKEPDAEVIEEPKSPSNTDPELTELVCEITSAIANASAEGREYVLSEEQKRTLEKHQQLIQDYQQKKQKYQQLLKLRQQSQLNPEQMSMLLANKKFPNYRLLGRNIFEPNNKQKVFQKRIKTNTYYSRFIKQHPTNNLPLVFQKSIGLNEDKEEESGEKSKKKKSKKKKKKSASSSGLSSGDDDDDSGKKSRKRVDDVLEDGQIQPVNNESGSSSSGSESSASQSSSSSLSNQSERRARRRKAAKFNNDARNGHTDSDSSMLDLKEHLKPIGSYIKDRERMLNEMFRCIKGSKLKAMLPDILKVIFISQIFKLGLVDANLAARKN
ncbi:caspase activity and apoptosis inhibitor 1-like, partial [Brachionus plicatilis]